MTDPTTLLLVLMMGALPAQGLDASGAVSTPRIDHRQATQQQRINRGVASGELTRNEAARLQKEQTRIQRAEDKALADGRLTRKELTRIEDMQDRASAQISSQAHDRQHVH
jgi:CRISPR/Cas system-associated endoribonuclease Cas2